jgi:outer membrane protein OmpU
MRKLLLAASPLTGVSAIVALSANPAVAADGIKLGVGGFYKTAYMVVIDDDGEDELGNERNTDGFFQDAEIHFTGSAVLDNGLEVGARVELEGETDDDQIDEAWIWFSGGFGEIRIGSDDDALANSCVVPPGGTGNFSAFSPNQWGANGAPVGGNALGVEPFFSSNSVCTGVDEKGDAQKILYITPVFGGFQLTASYTPDGNEETHDDDAGPHVGMPDHSDVGTESRHNFSIYGTYTFEGEDWGLTAGLGGSWEGHREQGGTFTNIDEQDFYQAGINLSIGSFAIGVVGAYYHDAAGQHFVPVDIDIDAEVWVAGIGASYTMDAWTFGLQYSHRNSDTELNNVPAPFDQVETQQDRIVATVNYALGPGINIDGEVGYTWIDSDPEAENISPGTPEGLDDYDGLEFAIGTNFTF